MKIKAKLIFTLIMITSVLFVLAACSGLTPNLTGEEKAVPVYQGMEVSETLSNLSANNSISANITRLSNIGVTGNLNTNPIDQDDPFGTLDDGTISEVVTTEFFVTQTEVADYYSEINKDIFITVKLSNPDNFVILSFTLNGVFYQSYQFQDGSDSENLILKVNTGTVNGVKEYTIDAIKYIDGTDIKDAIFAGERTITVGLKHNSEPSVLVSDEVVNATSILLTVNLSDSQSLSTLNKIVLYDGTSLVQTYDLSLGDNNIVFDKLNINTLYQYAVISVYDLIDGNNSRLSIVGKKAIYTSDIVAINNVVPTQTSIGFGITVTDVDQVGSVSAIELYKGETLVEALTDLSVREFTGLLSNNEYTIKVTYTYDLNDGVGSQTLTINQAATTLAKATPTVVIDNIVPTQTSIGFGITVTDVDQVGSVSAIELYKGETLVEALTDLSVREFTGLLSNNEYTIKVTYTYDLNDGWGKINHTFSDQTQTKLLNGSGTESDPYLIANELEFVIIPLLDESTNIVYFKLISDLNFVDIDYSPIQDFYGSLDGFNNTISIKYIDFVSNVRVGLFSNNYGTIQNLNIESILDSDISTPIIYGSVAGINFGEIRNICITGIIDLTTSGAVTIGLVVGENYGYISNNKVNGTIVIKAGGQSKVGGIAGISQKNITESSFIGDIENVSSFAQPFTGGIVGFAKTGLIKNVYAHVNIFAQSLNNSYTSVGGIIGTIYYYGANIQIINAYSIGSGQAISTYRDFTGGIVGEIWLATANDYVEIRNTFSIMTIDARYAGHLVGDFRIDGGASILLDNNYIIEEQLIVKQQSGQDILNFDSLSIEEVYNNNFIIEVLLWDNNIWNIENLDYINETHPSLK